MFLRDFPGFAFYFCFYELLKRQFGADNNDCDLCDQRLTTSQRNLALSMSGGIAGIFTWLFCYPADTLKTKLQTAGPNCNKSAFGIAVEIYTAQGGLLRLYRGVHVQIMRAFPSNAAAMLVFEHARDFLQKL